MDAYLSKPVQLATLRSALERWLKPHSTAKTENKPIMLVLEPVDLERLKQVAPVESKEFDPLVQLYFQDTSDLLDRLHHAIRSKSVKKVGDLAHSALGASRMLGMVGIADALAQLEESAKHEAWISASTALQRSHHELHRAKEYVMRLKQEPVSHA